jgi:hypothetical protein
LFSSARFPNIRTLELLSAECFGRGDDWRKGDMEAECPGGATDDDVQSFFTELVSRVLLSTHQETMCGLLG